MPLPITFDYLYFSNWQSKQAYTTSTCMTLASCKTCTQTETTKKSEIRKFNMVDGRRIENHFLAITQLHVVPLSYGWYSFTNPGGMKG